MTDFDYDCYVKKQIAHSAAKKKNGSRSKRCSLPSDRFSKSELAKMNGEVLSYHMREPMEWREFTKLPADLATEYMNALIASFDVGAKHIAKMLGVTPNTLTKYVHRHIPGFSFRKAHRPSEKDLLAWSVFLGGSTVQEEDPPKEAEESGPPAPPSGSNAIKPLCVQTAEKAYDTAKLNARLIFSGENLNPSLIADAVSLLRCLSGVEIGEIDVTWQADDRRFRF